MSSSLPLALVQDAVSTGTRATFKLLDLPAPWIVVLVVVPAALGVAWLGYARERLSLHKRVVLASLRALAFLILLAVLFRPVWVERREEVRPAEVVVLVDDSASMLRKDAYAGDGAGREALGELAGKSPSDATRSEIARGFVDKELLPHLVDKGYVPRLFRFSDGLEPLPDTTALAGRGHATHVGDALSQALAAHRGRHVTDLVIVSDGRSNGGLSALDAARAAAQADLDVHTVVVGDTRPERNARVEIAEAPTSVLDGDEVAVSARVIGRGIAEGTRARVVLEELSSDGSQARPVAEEEVEIDERGSRAVLVAPAGAPDPRSNERRFRLSVAPVEGETLRDDNSVDFSVRVAPEKIRVLYVDAYPRWEYRYLKNLLLRADQNFDVHCYLLSATPDFQQECTRGLTPLREVPTARRELLERFDVVILGDVNPYEVSPDPARCEEFLASLHEFVERGGGLVMQAGESDAPRSFAGTPLEELLPVVVDPTGASSFDGDRTREVRPVLEDPADPHEVVRLVADPRQNRELWEESGGLRGFYWFHPVVRAKPGAQALLRHPELSNSHGRFPLLVAGYFPAGRTLFLAWDATWMWRFRFGDRYHERFWRNAIRWVALGRLKSGDRRVQIDALKTSYDLDERVTLEARALDEDFRPSESPTLEARLFGPDGEPVEVDLSLVPDRAGLYRASFDVERPGAYTAAVENEGQRVASADFEVVLPSRENADPSPDPEALRAIAAVANGRAVDAANAGTLIAEFKGDEEQRQPISAELEDAWDRASTLFLALFVFALEWILRKRWELI